MSIKIANLPIHDTIDESEFSLPHYAKYFGMLKEIVLNVPLYNILRYLVHWYTNVGFEQHDERCLRAAVKVHDALMAAPIVALLKAPDRPKKTLEELKELRKKWSEKQLDWRN